MEIDESLITAEVYYKKSGVDFYLVKVSMPDVGFHITSIVVGLSKNSDDGLYVKAPGFNYKGKEIKQVEFDSKGIFWSLIEPLVLEAVNTYNLPNKPNKDEVYTPTDEELNNPEKLLDDAIKIFGLDKPP